jgi:hypothetical protein
MKTNDELRQMGKGHLTLDTLNHYQRVWEKYKCLRDKGKSHVEACEEIGVSERHMYRIKEVVT